MGEHTDESSDAQRPEAAWSVTKAEFDGWAAKVRRGNMGVWFGAVLAVACVGMSLVWFTDQLPMQIVVTAITVFSLWQLVGNIRQARRLQNAIPEIWRSGGAVCPRCFEPLSEQPCKHGLTRNDRDALRATWEAGVRGDVGGAMQATALIARKSPRRGIVSTIKMLRERAFMSVMDPSKPIWKRLIGAILGFGIMMSVFMLAMEWARSGALPSPLRVVMTLIGYGVGFGGFMIAALAWSGVDAGHNRCKACRQIIAPGREAHPCSECGADLGASGAIVSGERRRDIRTACIGVAIGVLAMFSPFVVESSMFARLMPARMLLLQYGFSSPTTRFGIVQELDRRTLDPATTLEVAERLLAEASLQATSLDNNSFVGNALLSGALDARFAERVLRATTAIELTAPTEVERGVPFLVRVRPVHGTNLCQLTHFSLFTWSGLEIDGTLKPAPTKWLTRTSHGPESYPIEVTLDQPGTHRLRLRGYTAVAPIPAQWDPSFDADGSLKPDGRNIATIELTPVVEVIVK